MGSDQQKQIFDKEKKKIFCKKGGKLLPGNPFNLTMFLASLLIRNVLPVFSPQSGNFAAGH